MALRESVKMWTVELVGDAMIIVIMTVNSACKGEGLLIREQEK